MVSRRRRDPRSQVPSIGLSRIHVAAANSSEDEGDEGGGRECRFPSMIICSWNVRGLNAPSKVVEVRIFLHKNKVDIVALVEIG